MPLNPSVALGFQQPKLDNPLENYAQGLQLQHLAMQYQKLKRSNENQSALSRLFRENPNFADQATGLPTPAGIKAVYELDPMMGMQLAQQMQTGEIQRAGLKRDQVATENNQGQIDERKRKAQEEAVTKMNSAYVSAYDWAISKGATPEQAQAAAASTWPAGVPIPPSVDSVRATVVPPKEIVAQIDRKEDNARQLRAVEAAERRATAAENRPDPVTTVQIADPKDPSKAIVIDARSGKKIGDAPPPKPVAEKALPTGAAQKMFDNQQNLRKAQVALESIQKRDPNATGWKGYLPEAVLQRVDPAGVETRAAIADLGSMIIHDRSGAAVTAAEYPRLRPFIPLTTDSAATVEKKLKRFVEVYQELIADQQEFYRESGYNVPEMKSSKEEIVDVSGAIVKPYTGDSGKSIGEFTDADEKRLQELERKLSGSN